MTVTIAGVVRDLHALEEQYKATIHELQQKLERLLRLRDAEELCQADSYDGHIFTLLAWENNREGGEECHVVGVYDCLMMANLSKLKVTYLCAAEEVDMRMEVVSTRLGRASQYWVSVQHDEAHGATFSDYVGTCVSEADARTLNACGDVEVVKRDVNMDVCP